MDIGWPEILIIAVVILVLFGSRKMPDAARSLGRSLRILKTEVKGLHDDDQDTPSPPAATTAPAQLPAAPAAPPAPVPPSSVPSGSADRPDGS